jgi:hypothetical protein
MGLTAHAAASITEKHLSVSFHKQEKSNYCGPASSLQLLDYLWATPEQDVLAADWNPQKGTHGMNTIKNNGTTTPDMVRTINYFSGTNWWVASTVSDSTDFWVYLVVDINSDHPANMLVDTKYLSYYQGKSLNHFVTLAGYWTDGTTKKVDIVDPNYMTYGGIHNGESFTNAFNALNAQNWRENLAW